MEEILDDEHPVLAKSIVKELERGYSWNLRVEMG